MKAFGIKIRTRIIIEIWKTRKPWRGEKSNPAMPKLDMDMWPMRKCRSHKLVHIDKTVRVLDENLLT